MIRVVRSLRVSRFFGFGAAAADQAVSSASNFFALLVIARAMDVEQFGVFALGYAAVTLVLGSARAYFGTHVALQQDAGEARSAGDAAIGALLAIAAPLAGLTLLYVVLVAGAGEWRMALLIGLAAPVVCLQDVTRFIAVATGRPRVALASDVAWLVPVLTAYLIDFHLGATQVVLLWGGSAALGLVVAFVLLRPRVDVVGGLRMLVRPRAVVGAQMVAALAVTGSSVVMLSLVSLIADPSVLGAIRSASVLFGPLNALFAVIPLALTPLLYRNPRLGALRFQLAVTGALLAVVAVYGGILAVLPASIGELLLGKVWAYAHPILPATTVEYGSAGAIGIVLLALSTSLRARHLAVVAIAQAGLTVVVPVVAVLLFHTALAVAIGLAIAGWTAFTIGMLVQRRSPAPVRPEPSLVAQAVH